MDPTLALTHWLCAGQKSKGQEQIPQPKECWLEQSLLRGSGSVSSTSEWWTRCTRTPALGVPAALLESMWPLMDTLWKFLGANPQAPGTLGGCVLKARSVSASAISFFRILGGGISGPADFLGLRKLLHLAVYIQPASAPFPPTPPPGLASSELKTSG